MPTAKLISVSKAPVCRDASPNVAATASSRDSSWRSSVRTRANKWLQIVGVHLSARDRRLQCLARCGEFDDLRIRLIPEGERGRHESDTPEAPVQIDHAVDIVRMDTGVA